jgi:dihydrodipicolinate synthase/N-acetylneuraminate lyase
MHRLQQIQGVHADMVVAVDSGDDDMHHIFTVYGRHGAVGALKNWAPDRWSTQFEIVELN